MLSSPNTVFLRRTLKPWPGRRLSPDTAINIQDPLPDHSRSSRQQCHQHTVSAGTSWDLQPDVFSVITFHNSVSLGCENEPLDDGSTPTRFLAASAWILRVVTLIVSARLYSSSSLEVL